MTEQQLGAIERLAERFNSDLAHTNVLHEPYGLPEGWVSAAVHRKGTPPGRGTRETLKILAGVEPDGTIHS